MPKLKCTKSELFALEYVKDPTQKAGQLYQRCFASKKKMPACNVMAHTFLQSTHRVAKRIAELQEEIRRRAEEANAKALAAGEEAVFLTVEEIRKYLARVVRFKPESYNSEEHGDIPNGMKQTRYGTEMEIPNKLKAIELDCDLSGVGAKAKGGVALGEGMAALVAKLRK